MKAFHNISQVVPLDVQYYFMSMQMYKNIFSLDYHQGLHYQQVVNVDI